MGAGRGAAGTLGEGSISDPVGKWVRHANTTWACHNRHMSAHVHTWRCHIMVLPTAALHAPGHSPASQSHMQRVHQSLTLAQPPTPPLTSVNSNCMILLSAWEGQHSTKRSQWRCQAQEEHACDSHEPAGGWLGARLAAQIASCCCEKLQEGMESASPLHAAVYDMCWVCRRGSISLLQQDGC
jgi:hypothetical protein